MVHATLMTMGVGRITGYGSFLEGSRALLERHWAHTKSVGWNLCVGSTKGGAGYGILDESGCIE